MECSKFNLQARALEAAKHYKTAAEMGAAGLATNYIIDAMRDAARSERKLAFTLCEEYVKQLRNNIIVGGPFLSPYDVRQWLTSLARRIHRRAKKENGADGSWNEAQ